MPREKPPKLTPFFHSRILVLASHVFLGLVVLVLAFSLLSRHGYPYLVGAAVVVSNSMEPVIRPGDMVVYARTSFSVGDVVFYCVTPSHCVVHRVVDTITLRTVNGDLTMVVAKGDNAGTADAPVLVDKVVGKVVLTVLRELWIPLLLVLVAYALRGVVRIPVVGYSQIVVFSIAVLLIASVYATAPRLIAPEPVHIPAVNLAGAYVDYEACTLIVRYTGALVLETASVAVNSTPATVLSVSGREVVAKPDPSLLRTAFETGTPLEVKVEGELNNVAWLSGRYLVLVGGVDPKLSVSGNTLIVHNPNCFPVAVEVSLRYLVNGTWLWSNATLVVEGASHALVQAPEHAEESYALVHWFNQGDRRWIGLPVKTR